MSLSKGLGHGLGLAEARQSGTAKIVRYPDLTLDWTELGWTRRSSSYSHDLEQRRRHRGTPPMAVLWLLL